MIEKNEWMKIQDLGPNNLDVNVKIKVIQRTDSKERSNINHSSLQIFDILVGDETGVVVLILNEKMSKQIQINKNYIIKNAYTNLQKGKIRLNLLELSQVIETNEGISPNLSANISEKMYDTYPVYPKYRPSSEVKI